MLSNARRIAHPARPFALLASLCLLALATMNAAAQDAKPVQTPSPEESDDVVRITTELVQTDVMVFDKQGKFVDGLKADQFDLKVDGKPQAVTFFERVKAGAVDEDAQLAAARGGATRREGDKSGAVIPLDRGRTVFFFVDDIHMSHDSFVRVQKTLLKFIEDEIGQNDEAAVISATGQPGFLQQLTSEKAVLRAAVARLKPRVFSVRDLQTPPMSIAQALAIDRNDTHVTDFFVEAQLREMPGQSRANVEQQVKGRASNILRQHNFYNDNTLATLESLVRGSAPLPGRKLVFFISDGFLIDDREGGSRLRMRSLTDAAARSGVVIYSLGAAGLTTGNADASSASAFDPSGRLASTDLAEVRGVQEPLYTLAADTGGRALVNTNSLDASVERALTETAVYYLLAWRPEGVEAHTPKFRRIEASVRGRGDLRVVIRKGFYDAPPPDPAAKKKNDSKKPPAQQPTPLPPDKELMEALRARHPRVSFPTSLALGYVSTPGQGTTLTASIGIDRDLLKRLAPVTKEGARVDVIGAVYNDKGDAVSAFKQELSIQHGEADEGGGRHTALYTHPFRLTPGIYQVRVAALERQTNRAGSASQWVEIPPLGQGQFGMSSLFIAERRAGAATAASAAAASGAPDSALLSVDGRFARASAMRFVTYIYNATTGPNSAPPDVALQVQMFRDDQPVFTAPLIKVRTEGITDLTHIPYAAELPLGSFPPGRYMLQITALDRVAKTSTIRRARFIID